MAAGTAPGPADDVPAGFGEYDDEPVPSAPVGAPGKDGRLELSFARDGDRTRLVRDFARVPFHLSGTLDHDPLPRSTTACVQSPSGGVAQGDRRRVSVDVGADARAVVTDGSSTKVLSMDANYGRADRSLSVASGGHLEYVPEPTILHADARYCQRTRLDLAPDATAMVADVVVPGRLARGERFAFERYRGSFVAARDGRRVCEDVTQLHPASDDPAAPGVLGEFAVLGSLYVFDGGDGPIEADDGPVGSDGPVEGDDLSDRLHAAVADGDRPAGATALPCDAGVLVRALGDTADEVRADLRAARAAARAALFDADLPPRRRY